MKNKNDGMYLSEDQKIALDQLEDFIESDNRFITISGNAGSGKTTVLREFALLLDSKDVPFVLCAPTHRAKLVMERATCYDAVTLHSLLGLAPNIEIFELDYRDLTFLSRGYSSVPYEGIIVIDEASMISTGLYKLLEKVCQQYNCKVVFVGDVSQLQPVKEGSVSPVFKLNNVIKLTTIHRQNQDSGLLPVLLSLRNNPKRVFQGVESLQGSLFVYNDTKQFMIDSVPFFKRLMSNQNIEEVKLLAYTNDRVRALNRCVRKLVLENKSDNIINQNEILTGYDNFEYNKKKFYNSLDYIVTTKPEIIDKKIPNFIKLSGYQVQLYDTIYRSLQDIFILSPDNNQDYIDSLCQLLEKFRMDAITAKNSGNKTYSNLLWKKYFQTFNSFATFTDLMWDNRVIKRKSFDYGYASSIHKIQGGTLNNVFIDMRNVSLCRDVNELRQLQYVSLSRTKLDAYILQ